MRNLKYGIASIVFWDLADGGRTRETTTLKDVAWAARPAGPAAHAFSPDGKRLITAVVREKREGELIVWEIATGKRVATISGLGVMPHLVRFQADGKTLLVIGSHDPYLSRKPTEVRRWDLDGAKRVGDPIVLDRRDGTGSPDGGIPQFSPGFNRMLALNGGGDLVVQDLATGKQLGDVIPLDRADRLVAFSPDGDTLITVGSDWNGRKAWIWDLVGGRRPELLTSPAEIRELVFSPNDKMVLIISPDRAARLWNVPERIDSQISLMHRDDITCAAFSPDGSVVVTGCRDGQVRMWSTDSREPIGVPISQHKSVSGILFSPDGKNFASLDGGGFDQRYARIWKVPENSATRVLNYPTDTRAVDVERGRIAIGKRERHPGELFLSARAAFVRDAATGQELVGPLVHEWPFEFAEFSPDGKVLATVTRNSSTTWTEGKVNFWAVEAGKLLGSGAATKGMTLPVFPEFNPDGNRLATGSSQGLVQVWEVPSGKLVSPPELNHNEPQGKSSFRWVCAVAFSPDGQLLATAGLDRRVCLWDTRTWERRGVFPHPAAVMSVAFSPNGQELLTGCGDGCTRRWDIATSAQVGNALVEESAIGAVAEQPLAEFLAVSGGDAVQVWDRTTSQPVGPAVPHSGATFMRLDFSDDGRTLHAWWSGGGKIVDLPRPAAGDPALLRLHAEVMTGYELMPNGETRALAMPTWLARNAELKRSGFKFRKDRAEAKNW